MPAPACVPAIARGPFRAVTSILGEDRRTPGSHHGQATDTKGGDPASLRALKRYRQQGSKETRAIDAEVAEGSLARAGMSGSDCRLRARRPEAWP